MHKPLHSLVFTILLFMALALLSFTFPEKGLRIGERISLGFPTLASVLDQKPVKKDISKIIQAADAADSLADISDTVATPSDSVTSNIVFKDSLKPTLITSLQYTSRSCLYNFFESLIGLKADPRSIRVLHYGDSQIEGDRITDYIRMKLQGQFGGQGPGLISLMPISPSVTNKVSWSKSWDRYNVFAARDKRVVHNNYGVLAGFTRFCNPRKLSDTASALSGEIKIITSRAGGANVTGYKKIKMFYGNAQAKTWCEFYDGPALSGADSLETGGNFHVREYNVGLGSLTHEFKFKGKDSPDFYAISLESEQGVIVDNIALRGSSGTFYHQINFGQMKQFYDHLNVRLIILEFGGNALPAIKDPTMAVNYAGYLRGQISILKKLAPKASIIFIGPADMSVKDGTEYVTHPQLENTRDAIKKIVLETGCAFFDMYDCMGGKNSMVSWVDEKLAATDYIHFSPQGARKMATLFYSALISEYNTYLKIKK
jgi:lysophospholipase L1-like esterase